MTDIYDPRPPWRQRFDAARDPYTARNVLGITTTGGGGGAPVGAEYITATADATLTNERLLTNTASITWDFSTPGQAKASTTAGGGNVSNSGTPTAGQYGKWVTATTIQGVAPATVLTDIGAAPLASPTFTGDPKAPTPATADNDTSIATTAYVQAQGYLSTATAAATYQPLDADLTSLAAASATGAIYYRSAANTWATVTVGSGLSFTSGTLTATGGGTGNVSNSGTPTAGQMAQWTDATHIQGVSAPISSPQGRLTTSTGVPVPTASVAASSTVYYSPYVGTFAPLYNGTSFTMTDLAGELSQATTDTTKSPAATANDKNYDMFVWDDSGTKRCTRGPAWSSDTARGTGAGTTELIRVNGVMLNANAITNGPGAQRGTYVGTIRTGPGASTVLFQFGSAAANGGQGWIGVWNAYNRVNLWNSVSDNTATWTYGTATWRAAHGSNTMRVSFVSGLAEDGWEARYNCYITNAATNGLVGVGLDSTSVLSGWQGPIAIQSQSITSFSNYGATSIGFHFVQALEYSSGGTSTFLGTGSGFIAMGNALVFSWRC